MYLLLHNNILLGVKCNHMHSFVSLLWSDENIMATIITANMQLCMYVAMYVRMYVCPRCQPPRGRPAW